MKKNRIKKVLAAGVLALTLGLLSPAAAGLTDTAAEAASADSIPSGAVTYNGHSYYFYDSSKTWSKAKAYCEARGGHLVTFETTGELNFIKKKITSQSKNWYWIGLKRDNSTGLFTWVNGNKLTVTSWGSVEPSGDADGCVMMLAKDYSDASIGAGYPAGKWNDATNGGNTGFWARSKGGFLCEWDTTRYGITKSDGTDVTSLTLSVGQSVKLKMKGVSGTATWSSSKKSVATVTQKGTVKAEKAGTATITAKAGGKTCKVKVTVLNNDATAKLLTFSVSDGAFVQGGSEARVRFKMNKTVSDVTVTIVNKSGSVVYKKTYSKCKANTTYGFYWNGKKNGTGACAAAGAYRVKVKAGTKTTTSKSLTLKKQEFAGGCGSAANPFQVSTFAQLKKVKSYNGCCFVQTADIDAGNAVFAGMFTEEKPFTGTYDGGGYAIRNLTLSGSSDTVLALFHWIGSTGIVKNVVMDSVTAGGRTNVGILAATNYGTLSGCRVVNCTVTASNTGSGSSRAEAALLCYENRAGGTVIGCTVSGGSVSAVNANSYNSDSRANTAGLVMFNYGNVMNSRVENAALSSTVDAYNAYTAALVNYNEGTVKSCAAVSVSLSAAGRSRTVACGVCVTNKGGTILDCSFTGSGVNSGNVYNNTGTYA